MTPHIRVQWRFVAAPAPALMCYVYAVDGLTCCYNAICFGETVQVSQMRRNIRDLLRPLLFVFAENHSGLLLTVGVAVKDNSKSIDSS